ncbi:MAG TPA: serine hydrolase domain-containing protein [Pyrinomonadaceae bacterium]|nr:serine hydrolase domain-containing protein [Pyrinomonadaceae bacterium]
MNIRKLSILFLLVGVVGLVSDAQTKGGDLSISLTNAVAAPTHLDAATEKDRGLQTRLRQYLDRVALFGFSGGILVAKNGAVLVEKGYGYADRARRLPNTSDTVFYIGSNTKQFTAAAILKLEQQGKLSVNDPISKFFANVPEDKAGITIHHLLTHTSGLAHDVGDLYGRPVGRDEQVRHVLDSKLQAKPGTYGYSNAGYMLAAAIVEIASGSSYESYLQRNLFDPAGMSHTGYRLPKWDPARVAHGYEAGVDQGSPLDRASWMADGPTWAVRGAGGMLSTLGDQYRWHRALEGDSILSATQRQKLITPYVLEDGGPTHYGYGWSISTTPRHTRLVGHNGSDGIFYASFDRYLDEGVVVIMITNEITPEFNAIHERVKRMAFEPLNPVVPPEVPAHLKTPPVSLYKGRYRSSRSAAFDISVDGDRLVLRPVGQDAINFLCGAGDELAKNLTQMTSSTGTLLAEAREGKFDLLLAATGKNFEAFKGFFEGQLKAGGAGSAEILGSVPDWWTGDLRPVTVIKPGAGAVLLSVYWKGPKIVEMGAGVPEPYRAVLIPRSDKEFVGYHPGLETVLKVSFGGGPGGRANILTVTTPHGTISAQKESP